MRIIFLHILANTFVSFLLWSFSPMWSSSSWIQFVFLWWLMMPSNFSCSYWPFMYFLWRNIYSHSFLIFNYLSYCSLMCCTRIPFTKYLLYILWFVNIFPPVGYLHCFDSVFWWTKVFHFDEVSLFFPLVACDFSCHN